MTYVIQAVLWATLAAALGAPAFFVARRRRRPDVIRRFAWAAVGVGVVGALLALSSDVLVERCRSAGNTGCVDSGTTGLQFLIFAVYVIAALTAAYMLNRN